MTTTWNNGTMSTSTFVNGTKATSTFTNESKSSSPAIYTVIGMATGLICPPTYATELLISPSGETVYTNQTKN
jgi:hypothetical protein